MTDKKNKRKEKDTSNGSVSPAEAASTTGAEELEELKTQLAAAQAKSQEYLDALLRERADFTNFRRRMEQEKSQIWSQATGELLKKFLPVMDDLQLALQNRPAEDVWANGVELIYHKFQTLLEKEGVTRLQAEGQPFDPRFHEAILQEASEVHASGTVIAVLRQGYLQGDLVLRPALVKVAE